MYQKSDMSLKGQYLGYLPNWLESLSVSLVYTLQALGSGDLSSLGNELTDTPEEEGEFDVLNDETFGDIAEGNAHIVLKTLPDKAVI